MFFRLYCHIIFFLSIFNFSLSIFAVSGEMNGYFVNQFYSDVFVTLQICLGSEDVHGFWKLSSHYMYLSYDVASGSEITPCNKIDKPLVVYRFTGNVMTSITALRT